MDDFKLSIYLLLVYYAYTYYQWAFKKKKKTVIVVQTITSIINFISNLIESASEAAKLYEHVDKRILFTINANVLCELA